jgi:hypothetical protein
MDFQSHPNSTQAISKTTIGDQSFLDLKALYFECLKRFTRLFITELCLSEAKSKNRHQKNGPQ